MESTQIVGPAANVCGTAKPKVRYEIPFRVAERAATKYTIDENGCWISTYSVGSHGYAQIGWNGPDYRTATTAHRAAWVYANGTQIPDGMTIDHLCKNRRCVNPNHLRMLTNYENARRTFGRDWPIGECVNGHPNSALVQEPVRGRWHCSLCLAQWRINDNKARVEKRKTAGEDHE